MSRVEAPCTPRLEPPDGWRGRGVAALMLAAASLWACNAAMPDGLWIGRLELAATGNQLAAALSLARHEAMRRQQRVTLCRSVDAQTCSRGADWPGWLVFVDSDDDGNVGAGEPVLAARQLQGPLVLRPSPAIASADDRIAFDTDGRAAGPRRRALVHAQLRLCADAGSDGSQARPLAITQDGRPRLGPPTEMADCRSAPTDI